MDGGGYAAYSAWTYSKRQPTFLQRNLRLALMSRLEMNFSSSTEQGRETGKKSFDRLKSSKRRKIDVESPNRKPAFRKPALQRQGQRLAFTRAVDARGDPFSRPSPVTLQKARRHDFGTGHFPEAPDEHPKVLRIDISDIVHKDSDFHDSLTPGAEISQVLGSDCRCSIAIYLVTHDEGPDGTDAVVQHQELIRDNLLGTIEQSGRVNLPGPFLVPCHKLFDLSTRNQGELELGEHYTLQIWFESASRLTKWPPLRFAEGLNRKGPISKRLSGGLQSREILLVGVTDQILDPDRQCSPIPLALKLKNDKESTSYSMRINIRWSLPVNLTATSLAIKTSPLLSKCTGGHTIVTYNLTSIEDGSTRPCRVVGWTCAFCNKTMESKTALQFHLVTDHDAFLFGFRDSNSSPDEHFIQVVKQRDVPRPNSDPFGTISLGLPRGPFDLESYVKGDHSWISNRLESLDGFRIAEFHRSDSSCITSRTSSPNTSVDNCSDIVPDAKSATAVPPSTQETSRPQSLLHTAIIPKTSRPLYDSRTMQVLQPGQEYSIEPPDKGWLYAKHIDIINDFTDVTAEEKDYIHRWDPFMMQENITSACRFPAALEKFLSLNGPWFREKPSRALEFTKHMIALFRRGLIREMSLRVCSQTLRQIYNDGNKASKKKNKGKGRQVDDCVEEQVVKPRGARDCICGQPVFPSRMIICQGRNCTHRFYHRACVEEPASRTAWICSECR